MTQIHSISRERGDTYPVAMTMTNPDGTAMDLTDKQVLLTVNTEEDPEDTTNQVFQIVGTITDAEAGKVEFPLTADQADNVGAFFYDVEVSGVSNSVYFWTADGGAAVDGSDGAYYIPIHVNDSWAYIDRDGTPVLQLSYVRADSTGWRGLMFMGWPGIDYSKSFRLSGLFYMDETWDTVFTTHWTRYDVESSVAINYLIENEPGYRSIASGAQLPDEVTQITDYALVRSDSQAWSMGWIRWVFEWDSVTKVMTARAWQPPGESDPGSPMLTTEALNIPPGISPSSFYMAFRTYAAVGTPEIAWVQLEILS